MSANTADGHLDAPTSITREARAKINPFLRVEGSRRDGYHQIRSLILPITLSDEVRVEPAGSLNVDVVGLDANEPSADPAPGMNLALLAALTLSEECSRARGAQITITKAIPVAAGLGGGSADAAATLLALNELWGCGVDDVSLSALAGQVGSDVPAMLSDRPVKVRGRGEIVEPAAIPELHWVLLSLGFPTRSPDAYRWWDEDGSVTGPEPDAVLAAAQGPDPVALGPMLFNDLQEPVVQRHPEVGDAVDRFMAAGALGSIMSGSGPTVVGLARDANHARELSASIPGSITVKSTSGTEG